MKKAFAIILLIAILSMVIVGCGQKAETKTTGTSAQVSADISDVDAVDQDVSTSDLDTMDKDLANVNW